jgi:hypothetical protein
MAPTPDNDAFREAFRKPGEQFARVRTVVTDQSNPLLRLAAVLFLLLAALFVLVVLIPVAILFSIVLFVWGLIAGLLGRLRATLEGRGAIRSREGRKNVRVIRR